MRHEDRRASDEILWDLIRGKEHLGGAPLNFAVNAHRLGHDVRLVSAVGERLNAVAGLSRKCAALDSPPILCDASSRRRAWSPSRLKRASRSTPFIVRRPRFLEFDARLIEFQPDWIYFGTLLSVNDHAAGVLREILTRVPARRFYDVNLRRDSFTRELVEQLAGAADAIKLNEGELAALAWRLEKMPARFKCVTRGERGCVVMIGDDSAECDGYRVPVEDTVGAGDAFAAAFLHGIGEGWPAARVGDFANRVAALVVSRPGAIPEWSADEIRTI